MTDIGYMYAQTKNSSNYLVLDSDNVEISNNLIVGNDLNINGGFAIDNSYGQPSSTLISQGPSNPPIWRPPAFHSCTYSSDTYDTQEPSMVGAWTPMVNWSNEFDPVGFESTSDHPFTIPAGKVIGYYFLSWHIIIQSSVAHQYLFKNVQVEIKKSGTTISRGRFERGTTYDQHSVTLSGSKIIRMSGGDYITLQTLAGTTHEYRVMSTTSISIYQIG